MFLEPSEVGEVDVLIQEGEVDMADMQEREVAAVVKGAKVLMNIRKTRML